MKTIIRMLSIGAVAFSVSAIPAAAQTPLNTPLNLDGRWTPWMGCWRVAQDSVRAGGASLDAALGPSAPESVLPGMIVCVSPSDSGAGVAMTTFAEGKPILAQNVLADGAGHPFTDTGCEGTQTSKWSRDGQRLFTAVEVACNGQSPHHVSGLTLLAKGGVWIDIQAIDTDGDQHVRVRRYERTAEHPAGAKALAPALSARAVTDARAAGAQSMNLDDVTEASARVASEVVEAALVETGARFGLNSKALTTLADSGVSPNVIDLMVAQSFPAHFQVDRQVNTPPQLASGALQYPTPLSLYPYGAYDPYAYYYYSPFAYPYYWGNNYYRGSTYYYTNGVGAVIEPNGQSGGGGGTTTNSDRGQVINGRGYTRVHTGSAADATPTPAQATATAARTGRTGSTASSASSASGSTGSSSSSSGSSDSSTPAGASTTGYSSGGSSSTGRTAQPR